MPPQKKIVAYTITTDAALRRIVGELRIIEADGGLSKDDHALIIREIHQYTRHMWPEDWEPQ